VRQLSEAPLPRPRPLSAYRRADEAWRAAEHRERKVKARRARGARRPGAANQHRARHSLRPRPSTRRYVRACPRSIARPPRRRARATPLVITQVAVVLGVGKMARQSSAGLGGDRRSPQLTAEAAGQGVACPAEVFTRPAQWRGAALGMPSRAAGEGDMFVVFHLSVSTSGDQPLDQATCHLGLESFATGTGY